MIASHSTLCHLFYRLKNTAHLAIPDEKIFHTFEHPYHPEPLWTSPSSIAQFLQWSHTAQNIQEAGEPGLYYKA